MTTNYLALDVGSVRIGVARANDIVRIASALPAIANDDTTQEVLKGLIANEQITDVIVGLPRGLDGQATQQTNYVTQFVKDVITSLPVAVRMQDEALTSVKAEAELQQRGKPFSKGDVDSLSAVYILEDFLTQGVH